MAISMYDPERHRPLRFRYGGVDAGVDCLSYAAWTLWQLGYPDRLSNGAMRRSRWLKRCPIPLVWLLRSCLLAFCVNFGGSHAQLKRAADRCDCALCRARVN